MQSPRINAAANAWEFATPPVTLLTQAEGTDATAAATNVWTYAVSGLTVKDTLMLILRHSSITQQTAEPVIYNVTDSLNILTQTNNLNALAGGTYGGVTMFFGADPGANTQITTTAMALTAGAGGVLAQTLANGGQETAFITAWTAAWTLALRTGAGGVTAGGTYRFRVALYKIAGQ